MKRQKKLIFAGVAILAVTGIGYVTFMLLNKPEKVVIETSESSSNEQIIINDFTFPEIDEIIKNSANNQEAAVRLISFGQLKASIDKNTEAYVFFEKAATLQDITEEVKAAAYKGMYDAATKLQDTAKQAAARAAMGEAVFNAYYSPGPESDQSGQ
jgi:hypothetical protein